MQHLNMHAEQSRFPGSEKTHMKIRNQAGASAALLLAASMALPAVAQSTSAQDTSAQSATNATQTAPNANPADNSTYASGSPLQTQSKEGFWGHLNPFARKKWVKRQLDPVKGRLNELDQLQAKNASDIRSLDERTGAGIKQAQSTADQANQVAGTANTTAGQAQQLASTANTQNGKINTTVQGLDQYSKVSDTELLFRPGQTALNAKAKEALDQVATQLQSQKGYLVEVAGFSRTRGQVGIQNSQRMSDAVVRYLVTEHQIPVYRIRQIALGNAPAPDGTTAPTGNAVRVSVVQNSLAGSGSPSGNSTGTGTAPAGTASSTPTSGPTQ